MSVTEWRAALWGMLHGTYISKPSQQSHISTFQEDAFVFTWLRLQKAVDKLLKTATESGAELDSVTELQRLQGIANQVTSGPAACALHVKRLLGLHCSNNVSYGQTHCSREGHCHAVWDLE